MSNQRPPHRSQFDLGQIVATPGALEAIHHAGQHPMSFLDRHASGDWGDLHEEDRGLNDKALHDGGRILSVYETSKGERLWIITEAVGNDGRRASTCLLLPEEY